MFEKRVVHHADYVLIGAGIMSATLGMFLQELDPKKKMMIFERMDEMAAESSSAWNNAGTGHAAQCELNYTPEKEDGSIDISKAIKIHAQFEESRQFWTYLLNKHSLEHSENFLSTIPHMSFVYGNEDVDFLRKRYESMKAHPFFSSMQFSEDPKKIAQWIPLMMHDRNPDEAVAATCIEKGFDVNFGSLTCAMLETLKSSENTELRLGAEVRNIQRLEDGTWQLTIKDLHTQEQYDVQSPFVFIGAGGGSILLLEKADIPEAEGYGGFPVSGEWLVCHNKDIIAQHHAKVYGKAKVGAPPMSVPHLDTRKIEGENALFFGPFAGFSTKFLKNGSYLDLIKSVELANIMPMLAAGWHNIPLTKYLIDQVRLSFEDRMDALREFFLDAKNEDWELKIAGQRVQVIKKDDDEVGVLGFGTEIVSAADGSLAALLGASPGASTAVSIMLDILEKCFPAYQTEAWQQKINEIIPFRAAALIKHPENIEAARQLSERLYQNEV